MFTVIKNIKFKKEPRGKGIGMYTIYTECLLTSAVQYSSLKVFTNEKRDGLTVVSFDSVPRRLFIPALQ